MFKKLGTYGNDAKLFLGFILLQQFSPYLIRLLDPKFQHYGMEYIHKAMTGLVIWGMCLTAVKVVMYMVWPSIDNFLEVDYSETFKSLTRWKKTVIGSLVYFLLLLSLILTIGVMPD